jgi:predicted nucleic acid-binding protein
MSNPLSAILEGSVVFVDANIFVYGFLRESEESADLMERCRSQDLRAATTLEVVGEVCHRLMLKEARDLGIIPRMNASSLKAKQDRIRGLRKYWELTNLIFEWNFAILPSNEVRHHRAHEVRTEYGLLTNDSLVVAACFEHGIGLIATHDADFERIPRLAVFRPTDIRQ